MNPTLHEILALVIKEYGATCGLALLKVITHGIDVEYEKSYNHIPKTYHELIAAWQVEFAEGE